MSNETPSAYAQLQHAENILIGYRACVTDDRDVGYEPPASPGSAREVSYRAGWTVASFDLAARRLHSAGLHCRVRGEDVTVKMELIGGTEYEPNVREGVGMFTGWTFLIYFNDEGDIEAHVVGHHTGKVIQQEHWPESLNTELEQAAEFIIHTCRALKFGGNDKEPVCAACDYPINKGYPADDGKDERCPVCGAPMEKS